MMRTTQDFSDGHLWVSVVTRPPHSSFSRVQRISCCFSLLLCTMLTSIMFYGIPTDPSDQVMDLGHFEFTWQQLMVGVQSSLIMFPVNIVIVSIFRLSKSRPKTSSCCRPDSEGRLTKSGAKSKSRSITRLQKQLGSVLLELEDYVSHRDVRKALQPDPADLHRGAEPQRRPRPGPAETMDLDQTQTRSRPSVFQQESVQSPGPEGETERGPRALQVSEHFPSEHFPSEHFSSEHFSSEHFSSEHFSSEHFTSEHFSSEHFSSEHFSSEHFTSEEIIHPQKSQLLPPGPSRFSLPWYCVYLGWLLVAASAGVSGYFTMLYGLSFGKPKSVSWLVSMSVSFFQSLLLIQPLKVVCLAVFFSLLVKKVEEEELGNVQIHTDIRSKDQILHTLFTHGDTDMSVYAPPPAADIEEMKRSRELETKAYALMAEILTYAGFMWMLLLVAYGQRDPNAFLLNQHLLRTFRPDPDQSLSLDQVYSWTQTRLLPNLFGPYPGFITDGNSLLVGGARLRQLRVKGPVGRAPEPLHMHRNPEYTWDWEDMGSYGPKWTGLNSTERDPGTGLNRTERDPGTGLNRTERDPGTGLNRTERDPGTGLNRTERDLGGLGSGPWRYQKPQQLRTPALWGHRVLYRGGGYVAELGPRATNASRTLQYLCSVLQDSTVPVLCVAGLYSTCALCCRTLQYLCSRRWLDSLTRAVFAEFTVYNANVNLFCVVALLLEAEHATGAFSFHWQLQPVRLYPSTGGLHLFVMAAEIIYMLFVLYYMYKQVQKLRTQRFSYFSVRWNLLELSIIALSWAGVGLFITRTVLGQREMDYYHANRDSFPSFWSVASSDQMLQYVVAFLVLLSTVKLWHLLRLNPNMELVSSALTRASSDICSFLLVMGLMLTAYATTCNILFGWKMESYKTLSDSMITLIRLQVGMFDYSEVLDQSPVLGGLLIGSCVVLLGFVVLNLLVSVILVSFQQEQIHHQPSDEEEVVHIMLQKVFSMFGVRYSGSPSAERSRNCSKNQEEDLQKTEH
uniref:Uncharacterized protein n=1 Tax=Knipowitschia caucasica TaxID=637954 RepID=A0AAV2JYE4_KNICA